VSIPKTDAAIRQGFQVWRQAWMSGQDGIRLHSVGDHKQNVRSLHISFSHF
jgi:hypothetical protein